MTRRDHARRLLLVLLANERGDTPARTRDDPADEPQAHRAASENGGGTEAADQARDTGDAWRMWAPQSPVWGASRST